MFGKQLRRHSIVGTEEDRRARVRALQGHMEANPPKRLGKPLFGKPKRGASQPQHRQAPKAPGQFDLARILVAAGDALTEGGGTQIRAFDDRRRAEHEQAMQAYGQQTALDQIFAANGRPPVALQAQAPAATPTPYKPERRGRGDGNPFNNSYGSANMSLIERLQSGPAEVAAARKEERARQTVHEMMQAQNGSHSASVASQAAFSPQMQAWARAHPQAFLDAWGAQQFQQRASHQARLQAEAEADQYGLTGHERLAFIANREKYGENISERFGVNTTGVGETTHFGNGNSYHNFDYQGVGQNEAALEGHRVRAVGDQLDYDADMAKVGLGRDELTLAQQIEARTAANGGDVTYGLEPEYVQLPDGSYVPVQLSKQGGAQIVPMPSGLPEGSRFAGPADVAGQRAYGQTRGTADAKREAGLPQAARKLASFENRVGMINGWIDTAITQVNDFNTGPISQFNPFAGGTDLAGTLSSIMANSGFEELQRMRDESPTGGALGQVTEREIGLLQALKGNIQRSQTPEQLVKNLTAYRTQYAQSLQAIQAAYEQDMNAGLFNAPQSTPARPLDYIGPGSQGGSEWTPNLEDEMQRLERELGGAR